MLPRPITLSRPPQAAAASNATAALALAGLLIAGLLGPTRAQAAPVEVVVTQANGAPIAQAVVSVQVRGTPATSPPGTTAQIGQRGKRFQPDVLAIQTGTAVDFPNFDTVRHHVYSFSPTKTFELKLYAATPAAPVVFDKPGTAVLGCNIHDAMTAHVRVVDTPYFALTDAQGKAVLDVPAGSHLMKVWHRGLPVDSEPEARPLTVTATGARVAVQAEAP